MLLFAFSFEAEAEKYGAYLGIASFFGLAVLSLLYFSQARELKRLREWAGRAPERARELEQRVVAQATATVARRPPAAAAPGAKMAPPRRLAEMPAPPPASAGAAAAAAAAPEGGATQVADAPPTDPETNGSVPPAPGGTAPEPAAASPGNGAEPAEGEDAEAVAAELAEPVADPNETHEFDAEEAAAATAAAEDDEAPDEVEQPDEESGEHEAPAAPATAAGAAGAAAAAGTAAAAAGASAAGPETDPSVPRLTPAQRVGVAPRPEPLPLRQSQPSATPAGRRPTAKPAARRPAPEREGEGRSAGTIALLVGLAVLLLGGAAFGASQLFGGDDNAPRPNQAAPPPTQSQTATTEGGEANAATPASETTVAVLNGTTFNGLAGNLADQLSQEGGYQRGITETNVRDQTLQESTVYYADGFRRQARDVANLLTISTVQPIDEETAALAQDADVVVLAGADQAP